MYRFSSEFLFNFLDFAKSRVCFSGFTYLTSCFSVIFESSRVLFWPTRASGSSQNLEVKRSIYVLFIIILRTLKFLLYFLFNLFFTVLQISQFVIIVEIQLILFLTRSSIFFLVSFRNNLKLFGAKYLKKYVYKIISYLVNLL